jgi:UDP-glucuronate decarboxylase
MVRGLIAMMQSASHGPINLGNPVEMTVGELAKRVISLCNSKSKIVNKPLPTDDPTRRKPDITLAKKELNWEPKVDLEAGLRQTIADFEQRLRNA